MSRPNTFIHLHTLDLRTHDLPSLHLSHSPRSSISKRVTHFLPVYIIDSRQLDISHLPHALPSLPPRLPNANSPAEDGSGHGEQDKGDNNTRPSPRSRVANFHRTSPYRLRFLLESIFYLRDTYRRAGGDLLIGYGRADRLLPVLVQKLKETSEVEGVWAQDEVTVEEKDMLANLEVVLQKIGVKLNKVDSKTLLAIKDLPFDRRQTPDVYTAFRKNCEGLGLSLGGMLKQPLRTSHLSQGNVKIDIDGQGLKPFPQMDFSTIPEGCGVLEKDTSVGEVYTELVKPLLDSPPVGGWSRVAEEKDALPVFHPSSAVPFEGGEKAALERLDDYVGHEDGKGWIGGGKAKQYKATRNGMIGEGFSTKFSCWLSLGCLSAREIGWRVGGLLGKVDRKDKDTYNNVYWIIFELLWRDFFQSTVYKYSLSSKYSLFLPKGFSEQINTYPRSQRPNPQEWHYPNWENEDDPARRWCEGRTGVPFVDANMRELRETGWMSNRGRQNVASFLVKDLYVDWRVGAEFFEMHLVDYDTCSNWGNWQYQAGVGNDPRSSRQFNPLKQAKDYDPKNDYTKLWLSELKVLPPTFVQTPWLLDDNQKPKGYPVKPVVEQQTWHKFYPRGSHTSTHRHGENTGQHDRGGGHGHVRKEGRNGRDGHEDKRAHGRSDQGL
ncbi:hypothetical protein M231_02471 [Tremella mesenterica]|uniref:Cryptochrome DASH n=1 Tax=Tremella mesenterica TaxID=5217 RepID=A0A4V1M4F6_TREME|nr:hypothetical protein M231_02471 [Tremella mesenterica]